MKLENILAVSGMPGLYKLVTTRKNGLVIEDYDNAKRTFISLRKHQFTPLQSVAIYTYSDVEEIQEIFRRMRDQKAVHPIPESNAPSDDLHAYFREILPEYNEDRVYVSDIKKIIKWFAFLEERNMLLETAGEEEE
jgi:hypothetical protein